MKYHIFSIKNIEEIIEYIVIHNKDGSFKSFPIDGKNPEYVYFQKHIADYVLEDFN